MTTKEVKAFNIRNFPTDLYWRLKAASAHERTSMRAFVVKVLDGAVKKVLK